MIIRQDDIDDDDDGTDDSDCGDDDGDEGCGDELDYLEDGNGDGMAPYEVEERVYEFGAERSKLSFKIYLQEDPNVGSLSWTKIIHVDAYSEGKVIGRGLGRYVKRNDIRGHFQREMEGPSEELSNVAFDLFDRYGRLKRELINHTIRKGTGVWGKELDYGDFFLIENLRIGSDWRRKGVGKRIARDLIEKSHKGGRNPAFSLVRPGCIGFELRKVTKGKTKLEKHEIEISMRGKIIDFWRCQGFRRVGASDFFGLATDPNHPADTISSIADFNPADAEPDLDEEPPTEFLAPGIAISPGPWRLELLKERLPLHHAIVTLPDDECVQFFNSFKANVDNQSYDWNKVDRHSDNALHIAVQELKAKSLRWLLENVNEDQILASRRNVAGYTPQEKLESQLDSIRSTSRLGCMTMDVSREFKGYPPEAIECLVAFRGLSNLSKIQHERLKFGCTCSSCIDGFLSPRMKFQLLLKAETAHNLLNEGIEDGPAWYEESDKYIQYVPWNLRQRFRTNKSLRQGFSNLFLYTAEVLRKDITPNALTISAQLRFTGEWPPCTKNLLEKGRVESALQSLFKSTQDEGEWARDGGYLYAFKEDIDALPECRNDYEFEFVALMCGVPGWQDPDYP